MANFSPAMFSFAFQAHKNINAHLVKFQGWAGLNELYRIKVTLLVPSEDLANAEWADFFATPCSLSLAEDYFEGGEGAQASHTVWTGLLTKMSTGSQLDAFTYLEVELTPYLGLLAGQLQNRLHLDMSSLDILRDSFQFGGLEPDHFKFLAQGTDYPKKEFTFQYEEDLLDFVWRTLHFDGLALFYEQQANNEVAVIADSNFLFPPLLDNEEEVVLKHVVTSGLFIKEGERPAYNFRAESSLPPKTLLLKDYNWEDPNRPLEVQTTVSPRGRGEVHLYGENFNSLAEGKRLSQIRREEILGNSELYCLTTPVLGFKPGLTFAMSGHPWGGFNDRYLTVKTEFSGSQSGALSSRLGVDLGIEDHGFTHNLVCQKVATPYRPKRPGPRKKITGSLTAWIDGAGTGDSPEIDQYGRYKILLPLDTSGRKGGKASAWVRMAQPYVGRGYGQNFPLTPGAEVLLTFVDGNPDRPVISGAVPNAETDNVINAGTSDMAGFGTKGGGGLMFGEKAGEQKTVLSAGSNRGGLSISAGSPTTTSIVSDYLDFLTSASRYTTTSMQDLTFTGWEHSVDVNCSTLMDIFSKLDVLKDDYIPESQELENYFTKDDVPVVSTIAHKSAALLEFGSDALHKVKALLALVDAFKARAISPHPNLIQLRANSQGSKSVLKTKNPPEASIFNIVSLLLTLMPMFEDMVPIIQGAKTFFAEPSSDDDAKDSPQATNAITKLPAIGVSKGTALMDFLSWVVSDISVIVSMTNLLGDTQGVLIDNLDSYVTIKALTTAALSGYGPTIVESNRGTLADLLRHKVSEKTGPLTLLTPDLAQGLSEPSYEDSKAVLILSELVRAVGEEINLSAYQALAAKSAGVIQIIAGLSEEDKTLLAARDLAKQPLIYAFNAMLAIPDTDTAARSVAMEVILSKIPSVLGELPPVRTDPDFNNGILIKAAGEGDPVLIQTSYPNGHIEILQGEGTLTGGPTSRRLFLDSESSTLQEGENVRLKLQESGNAVLQTNDDTYVKLDNVSVTIASEPASKIEVDMEGVALEGQNFARIKSGTNSVELTPTGAKISSGSNDLSVSPAAISLG
ncbi:MAG: type VI secretion system Vgr family protein [Deltaproteobacteria bacterium]|jgi:type VI secretion system VgrG family protein|nr:type VI secretion system Vgr family protein [Deltaproteobacteria bacterium]